MKRIFMKRVFALTMGMCFSFFMPGKIKIAADASEACEIVMNSIFSDHMILQREKRVEIYGKSEAGKEVKVSFNGQEKTGIADVNGNFSVCLDEMAAESTGQTLTVTAGSAVKIFYDVLVGEVYYGSGQSNMAYPMEEFTYAESVIEGDSSFGEDYEKYKNKPSYLEDFKKFDNYGSLRFYTQKMLPETNNVNNKGTQNVWIAPSSVNDLTYTSLTAVAYAIRLSEALGDVPVGIMVAAVGGSQIHEWISRDAAAEIFPGDGNATISQRYSNMLLPMGRFTIRGVLWYQGESDVYGTLENYRKCFFKWTEETRNFFNDPSLPIITFQLPQYEDESCRGLWAAFRALQEELADGIEGVYCVCGIDLGDHKNIHPTDKYEFCGRAAGLALKYIYGQDYCGTGFYGRSPVVEGLYRKSGTNVVYMRFSDATEITVSEGERTGLIATTNRQSYSKIASYEIAGKKTVSFISKLKYVSYLQENIFDYGTAFLYNEYGLPVAPFVDKEVQTYDHDVTLQLEGCTSEGDERYFVSDGDSVSFSIFPEVGYEFVCLTINGEPQEFGDGKVELNDVGADISVKCTFKKNDEGNGTDSSVDSSCSEESDDERDSDSGSSESESVGCCGNIGLLPLAILSFPIAACMKTRKKYK